MTQLSDLPVNEYQLSGGPLTVDNVTLQRRRQADGSSMWTIVLRKSWVLTKHLEWVLEPIPSERTDEFIQETRWGSADAAMQAWSDHKDVLIP